MAPAVHPPTGLERRGVDDILKRIESGKGMLTDEERTALDAYAESTGTQKEVWQVYDDSAAFDQGDIGMRKAGPQHPGMDAAVAWAEGQNLTAFTVFRETRVCTRKREIWYNPDRFPAYSQN